MPRSFSLRLVMLTLIIQLLYVIPSRIIVAVLIRFKTIFCAVPAFIRVEPVMTSGPTAVCIVTSAIFDIGVFSAQTIATVFAPLLLANSSAGEKFQFLVEIMARLRAPGGCPWDREQTFDTIKPFLLEETYEVMDAIDACDWQELAGELGDLLLQVVFFSQMAAERQFFRIEDALDAIAQKLIRRHPHVFGQETAETLGSP